MNLLRLIFNHRIQKSKQAVELKQILQNAIKMQAISQGGRLKIA